MCRKHGRFSGHDDIPEEDLFSCAFIYALSLNAVIAEGGTILERTEIDEKTRQKIPLDATFFDETGNQVRLKDLIKRPIILVYRGSAVKPLDFSMGI